MDINRGFRIKLAIVLLGIVMILSAFPMMIGGKPSRPL